MAGAPGEGPEEVDVAIKILDDGIEPPTYAHRFDAGADLRARVAVTLEPGERATVPTGLALAVPRGFVALVHPRSGLAARHGVTVLNAPGTIDADYRGEVAVVLVNTSRDRAVTLERGDRIAQLVLQRVAHARWQVAQDLPETVRGTGGFGSTGGFVPAGEDS
ncbi:dUTP diphosphatase [Miniimonas arenae]|uniref:Deoxyuridine 5'-triphosphate nucleotidohydrolase n=1 Tax=Miniimonas arenae TaxID=676201 RepID=A0A5C5BCR2_9MICO|nr:dUTP diphosphatase [Miniimonas arenae]TNU76120.1 dUTP diphosphatase [Miniimonas arenae]